MPKQISNQTKGLLKKLSTKNLPIREIARRARVAYSTAYYHNKTENRQQKKINRELTNEFIERTNVYRFETNNGSYIRFSDGRWMINIKNKSTEINKLYYVPQNYNRKLNKDELKYLDRDINMNSRNGVGKLVEIVSENEKDEIIIKGIVRSIEKIGL